MDLGARVRRLRRAVRRRERLAVVAYLAALGAALGVTCTPALRDPLLDRIEYATVRAGDRWRLRVEDGEAALAAARAEPDPVAREWRLEKLAAALEALDREFPAQHVKLARDAERVRLMRTIVLAQREAGRKGRALDAARRLVAFDPRRYESHLLRAETALAFDEPDEAAQAFAAVLAIHPNHLPSVAAVVDLHAEGGDWAGATAAFERYLEALWLERVAVRLGPTAVGEPLVPVDGRWHTLDLPLPAGATGGDPTLGCDVPLEVRGLGITPGREPGVATPDPAAPPARVHAQVRLRKPVDPELWEEVARSYRNQLDWDGLEAAQARIVVEEGAR